MADTTAPASFVVVNGRAYTLNTDGDLVSTPAADLAIDFDAAETVLDTRLLTEPTIATPAGKVIDELRTILKPLAAAKAAAAPADDADAVPFD